MRKTVVVNVEAVDEEAEGAFGVLSTVIDQSTIHKMRSDTHNHKHASKTFFASNSLSSVIWIPEGPTITKSTKSRFRAKEMYASLRNKKERREKARQTQKRERRQCPEVGRPRWHRQRLQHLVELYLEFPQDSQPLMTIDDQVPGESADSTPGKKHLRNLRN